MTASFHRFAAATSMRVVVCVCTCQRPVLLTRCLESLARQVLPNTLVVSLVVVDNDPAAGAEAIVDRFGAACAFPLHYIHEPVRSIPKARNAALAKANWLGAEWIAFIDDDEVADPDWLAHLMRPELLRFPVLAGNNIPLESDPPSFWAPRPRATLPPLRECKTAGGGNVRFHIDVVRAGLRFDETGALTGGEDTDFFARANAMGFRIAQIADAITREAVHPERLTYRGQIYRQFWEASCGARRMAREHGRIRALLCRGPSVLSGMLIGGLMVAASAPTALVSRAAFKRLALSGGKRFAKSAGRGAALLGIKPQPYRTIHGG